MQPSFSLGTKFRRILWAVLALLLSTRLVSLAVIPLTDTTESRYGEIARKMLETGNWITPQYDYGVPFWGKPPLSTWLSAISMKLLGVNEFAARLPEVLLSLGVLWFVWLLAKQRHNRDFGLLSVALLASLPLFFVAAGAVMTGVAEPAGAEPFYEGALQLGWFQNNRTFLSRGKSPRGAIRLQEYSYLCSEEFEETCRREHIILSRFCR